MIKEKIISISNISIKYENKEVLKNINLDVKKGDFIYFIGETGSGKSTLLKSLYKGVDFNNGEIIIMNQELSKLNRQKLPFFRRRLGIIFQDFQLLNDRTIHQNISTILRATGWTNKEKINNQIKKTLDIVHIENAENKMPYELSGGEQQRVSIARALLNNPEIILADEPTGNLDPEKSQKIIDTMIEINNSGTTIIIATHDYSIIDKTKSIIYRFKDQSIHKETI